MLLSVRNLCVSYGKIAALRGLDLEVDEGDIVALLGPNGAGKSTALRAISGMHRCDRGDVVFAGRRVTGWPSDAIARLGMSLVPEGRRLFAELSVEENLRMGGFRLDAPTLRRHIDEVTRIFPVLGERLGQRAATLSGGEQQQLAIARALVSRPRLLLIDEMSLGLAPLVTAELYRTVAAINALGTAVLLVEQQVALALRLARRAYFLDRGEVVLAGSTAELKTREAARSYLGEVSAVCDVDDDAHLSVELVRVPLRPTQTRALQQLAAQRRISVGEIVAEAITAYVGGNQTGVTTAPEVLP